MWEANLEQARRVTHVHEAHAAKVAVPVHPAAHHQRVPFLLRRRRAAVCRASLPAHTLAGAAVQRFSVLRRLLLSLCGRPKHGCRPSHTPMPGAEAQVLAAAVFRCCTRAGELPKTEACMCAAPWAEEQQQRDQPARHAKHYSVTLLEQY